MNKPIKVFYETGYDCNGALDFDIADWLPDYDDPSKFEIVLNKYKDISDEDDIKEGVTDWVWRIEVFKKEVSDG
tara:strand:+ start:1341 stop:1562 length:222 start_codon:yes stop_codon:yes gene_type:complete